MSRPFSTFGASTTPDGLRVTSAKPESSNGMHALLVVPCYNEASRLKLSAFDDYIAGYPTSRILFVDDGSKDQTADVIGEFCRSHADRAQLLSLPRNAGKAEAVRLGLLAAAESDADCIGFWDADLATPLEASREFAHVLARCPDVQVVWGTRLPLLGRAIERHPVRRLLGKVFSGCSAIATGLPIQDALCGAKLFRNGPLFRDLFSMPFQSRWIFDVEILIRLRTGKNEVRDADRLDTVRVSPGAVARDRRLSVENAGLRAGRHRAGWDLLANAHSRHRRHTAPACDRCRRLAESGIAGVMTAKGMWLNNGRRESRRSLHLACLTQ